jgi:uncharacterized membrane protein
MSPSILAHFKTLAAVLGVMGTVLLIYNYPGHAFGAFFVLFALFVVYLIYSGIYVFFSSKHNPSDFDDHGPN